MRKTKKSKILSLIVCMSLIISTFAFVPGLAYAENTGAATDQTTTETEPSTEKADGAAGSTTENTDAAGNDQTGNAAEVEAADEAQPASDDENTEAEASPAKTVDFTNVAPFLSPVDGKDSVARKARSAMAKAASSMIAAASGNSDGETSRVDNDGVVTTKTATPNDDGSYKIRLESYVTGATTTTTVTEDVPTDIVLVLDQSGSMAEDFTSITGYDYRKIENTNTSNYSNRSNLWYKLPDGTYTKVSVEWELGWPIKYTYTYKNGDETVEYISYGRDTYPDLELYTRTAITGGTTTRIAALKEAVSAFNESVAEKAKGKDGIAGTADDVNHRIAVVGFGSGDMSGSWNESYENTELFNGSKQTNYGKLKAADYQNAFQDLNTATGVSNIKASIDSLAASGATRADLGMDMAENILKNNPVENGEKRNRVVIMFTDGSPTSGNGFELDIANAAISKSDSIKTTQGATVYSVGIFAGADATSAGTKPSGNLSEGSQSLPAACNWFMQNLSSNNGTPQSPSYYLSASNSAALNDIFQQISSQIESGGASVKLDSSTVVKDIVSDYFQLPEGTQADDITLKTADFDGYESDNKTAKWKNESPATGVTAAIEENTVQVSGFDFAENYVGIDKNNGTETVRGKKLIIEFNVKARGGFLGGNAVPTNGKDSGIYTTKDGEETVVENFEQPTVDVPIKKIIAAASDKNVYLLGSVSQDELKAGISAKTTDDKVTFDLSKPNYGLEEWQTAYVDINHTLKNGKDAIGVNGLKNLTSDTDYTFTMTISPKNNGTFSGNTDSATGNINVFKPELTYKDSNVYYGDTAPTSYDGNKVGGTVWKHGNTILNASISIIGDAPDLALTYSPDIGSEPYYKGGKISTKQDISVKATVKIGDTDVTKYVAFKHETCGESGCGFNEKNEQFLIHVKTCSLTVKKTGGVTGEPYVMYIYKDGSQKPYTSMTIFGNGSETIKELPVGTYTVKEDTDWAWRYKTPGPEISSGVGLNKDDPTRTIMVNNQNRYQSFLNGYSTVVQNIFGQSKSN